MISRLLFYLRSWRGPIEDTSRRWDAALHRQACVGNELGRQAERQKEASEAFQAAVSNGLSEPLRQGGRMIRALYREHGHGPS